MNKDEALSKIRKLLAMANDGRGNLNEAETAMRQAQSLMRKYQIDSAEEVLADLKSGHDMVQETDSIWAYPSKNKPTKCPAWIGIISLGVGILNEVKTDITFTAAQGVVMRFSGYGPDVQFSKWLYRFLIETVYRMATEHAQSRGDREAFRYGMACTLQSRLKAMHEDQQTQDAENSEDKHDVVLREDRHNACTVLAIVDSKRLAVAAAFGSQEVKKGNKREVDANTAAGQAAGRKLNIPTARVLA